MKEEKIPIQNKYIKINNNNNNKKGATKILGQIQKKAEIPTAGEP